MAITRQQALDCFTSDDLIGIGMEADAVRRRLHPENVVTYLLDCPIACDASDLDTQIESALDRGATGLRLNGQRSLESLEELLTALSASYPTLTLHGPTATEILKHADGDLTTTLIRLRDAGLAGIPGDDTPLLDGSETANAWLDFHCAAHKLGIPTTASLTFGLGETPDQRIAHLEALRALQSETGGFTSFTPTPPPAGTLKIDAEPTAVEYLQTLAISRIYLDNIPHIQTSLATQGPKVLQMGLRFGSNDVGTLLAATSAESARLHTTEADLRRIIRGAGFLPAQRDTLFRTLFLN